MKGSINIKAEEIIHNGREAYSVSLDTNIELKGFAEKMILVHRLCQSLNFSDKEFKLLSVAAFKDYWPDTDTAQEIIEIDKKNINRARGTKGGENHD